MFFSNGSQMEGVQQELERVSTILFNTVEGIIVGGFVPSGKRLLVIGYVSSGNASPSAKLGLEATHPIVPVFILPGII